MKCFGFQTSVALCTRGSQVSPPMLSTAQKSRIQAAAAAAAGSASRGSQATRTVLGIGLSIEFSSCPKSVFHKRMQAKIRKASDASQYFFASSLTDPPSL